MRRRSTTALSAVVLAIGLVLSTAGAALALPDPDGYGATIDPYATHVRPTECLDVEQPGVVAFRQLLRDRYNANGGGILRGCHVGGASDHKEGRAYDWRLDAFRPADAALADEVIGWLLATDRHGNTHAMARRLGITYIIWNREIWSVWNRTWQPYTGPSPHTDHVHFSFGWEGALQQTSFWSGLISRTGFRDIPIGASYEDAVAWMLEHGITQGRARGIYDPSSTVNRGQMASFLWNLMDKPAVARSAAFADVPSDAHYADAVAWLGQEGITLGRADGIFAPRESVTRGQMASFLWRLAGRPATGTTNGFADVRPGDHYAEAAAWMAQHKISIGTAAGAFAGSEPISRAQMALFLHRFASTPAAWSAATVTPPSLVGN